jgi:hypothetical protein
MNQPEIERLIQHLENDLYQAINAVYESTRQEIDVQQLAEAIASEDDQAIANALDVASVDVSEHANEFLPELFAPFFELVAVIAASVLGHKGYTPARTALVIRDNLRFLLTKELASLNTNAAIQSTKVMAINSETPKVAAVYIVSNIGLTANQTKSLDTFRTMLVRGQKRNTTYFPASQLRRLNASQRSILRAIVPNEVTDEDVERLTSQQRKIMSNHRAQTIARGRAYELLHASRQTTWEALDQQRKIDGYKRFWKTANDERVRHSHRTVPSLNRHGRGLNEPFKTPLGRVQSPPLEINCRCHIELRPPS